MVEKTYAFEEKGNIITTEDRTCGFSFLLILDNNGKPKEPWVGTCISGTFINGRTLSGPRDYKYMEYLKEDAQRAAKNYLAEKHGKYGKKEERHWWDIYS